MLVLHFEGWFQCRLATNPDPTDEPRGVSGYTFALAGEPDLDRIIRVQDPVAPRSHGPEVGVVVTSVVLNGKVLASHPLLDAQLDLLDKPRFESRNLLLSDDRGGAGLIEPFFIQITGNGVTIRRLDVLYPEHPAAMLHEVPTGVLNRRAPIDLQGMRIDPIRIAQATGITSPIAYRKQRRDALAADLDHTIHPEERAALEKRLRELEIDDVEDIRLLTLSAVQTRKFRLNGPAELVGRTSSLEAAIDTSRDWPIEFWMGAWDADALCGYMGGMLSLPLRPDTRSVN